MSIKLGVVCFIIKRFILNEKLLQLLLILKISQVCLAKSVLIVFGIYEGDVSFEIFLAGKNQLFIVAPSS